MSGTNTAWILTSERLPDIYDDVLVVAYGRDKALELRASIEMACRGEDGEWHLYAFPQMRDVRVTHWMPLPELPEGVED